MVGKFEIIAKKLMEEGWIANGVVVLPILLVCFIVCYTNFSYTDIDIAFMTLYERGKKKVIDSTVAIIYVAFMFYAATTIKEVRIYLYLLCVITVPIWVIGNFLYTFKRLREFLIKKKRMFILR